MVLNMAGEQTSMTKNALWVAAVAAGVAAVAYGYMSNAEEHLKKINLKLHSNDSVA